MKAIRFFLAASILFLAALACNLTGSGSGPDTSSPATNPESADTSGPSEAGPANEDTTSTDEIQPDPSANEDPFEEAAPDIPSGSDSIAPGNPLDLDSPSFEVEPGLFNTYRASLDYSFSAPNGITGTLLMEGETRLEPYANSFVFRTFGQAVMGTEEEMIFTQFDGNEYVYSADFGCISGIIGQQGNPFDLAVDTYGVLTGQAAFHGEDFINGVDTYVYELTDENIDSLDEADLGITDLSEGWMYIAKEGDYVVRILLAGSGTNEGLSQDASLDGDLRYELNFFDFDVPVSFQIPEGCTVSENGEDFSLPLPDDATNITQFGEITSFATDLSPDETRSFYENAMPTYGCSDPEVVGDGSSMVSMNFENCDFGAVQIILTLEGDGKTLGTVFTAP